MSRILLVTNDFPPRRGGIQSYLEELVGRLATSGDHDITVYAPKWKGAEAFDTAADAAGYRVVRHPTTLMLPEPSVEARMRGLIERHDIETVWFGAAAPLALLAGRARRAGATRVLASTHGHEVGWSMLPVARSALRRIGDGADIITYVSRYTRGRFASAFGSHAAMEHVPPGVDTDRFRPEHRDGALRRALAPGGEAIIGYVGRLAKDKRVDLLEHVLKLRGVKVVVVGDGPELPRLRRRLRGAVFTGQRTGGDLSRLYASLDVFVHTGADETFCQTVQEALASGVPVVAPAAGGPLDLVEDGVNGLLYAPDSVRELRVAVGRLAHNRALRADLADRARASVEHRTWEAVGDELLAHYRSVLAPSRELAAGEPPALPAR